MYSYVQLLRPPQWVKNLFVFAALAFGNAMGKRIGSHSAIELSLYAFIAFCLASSSGYVLNDIFDRQRDRLHPMKKDRPIASGAVSVPAALLVLAGLVLVTTAVCVFLLPPRFWVTVAAYGFLSVAYSVVLKHRMILDVVTIAVLFVLRALGGAAAIDVAASPWLIICTFMLCLFLGFGKRRCEIAAIGDSDAIREHRPTLVRYTPHLLTHLLSTSGGMAIITFLLYTLDRNWPTPFEARKSQLVYTLPLVVYGIYRYAMLIELGKATGPTDLIIKDPPFLAAIVLWIALAALILYSPFDFWRLIPA
jgi:4-hydroxybenzoate polyprenyltransferase